MRSVDFGLGFELKSHGGYILDIREEKGKSMSRKMTFFLGLILGGLRTYFAIDLFFIVAIPQ
ncbi:MAG: hypothetical protein OXN27_19505 [Candidatus Poribacteria bacterium]|nr:hypothetical protein [Candidatus Poribacteria bacterium]